jgi:tripartite-type tricarboxylate transporter receptor subunit TctC
VAVKSAKDGYTLYMSNSSYAILPVIDPDAGYDAERDLAPVGLGATYGMAVVVNPALSAKTLGELLALAKQAPGKLTYGSAGMGSGSHFMGEHLKQLTGTNILHVPYKSTSLAVQDVAGGRVDLAFDGAVKPLADAGKVRIIAVTGAVRDPRFPQVPTVAEAGLGEFTFESWLGLFAPTDTPERIITRLNQAMNEALTDAGVKQRLADLGLTPGGGNTAFLKKQVSADLVNYRKIAADTRIKLQ